MTLNTEKPINVKKNFPCLGSVRTLATTYNASPPATYDIFHQVEGVRVPCNTFCPYATLSCCYQHQVPPYYHTFLGHQPRIVTCGSFFYFKRNVRKFLFIVFVCNRCYITRASYYRKCVTCKGICFLLPSKDRTTNPILIFIQLFIVNNPQTKKN